MPVNLLLGDEAVAQGAIDAGIAGAFGLPVMVRIVTRLAHSRANVELVKKEIAHRGLSVIVPNRACVHAKRKAIEMKKEQTIAAGG